MTRKVSNITAKKRFGSEAHKTHFIPHTHSETSTIIVPHICRLLLLWAFFLMTVCLWLRLSGLHLASDPNHDPVHCSLALILSLKPKPGLHVAVAIYWMHEFISLHMQLPQKILYASHKPPQKILYASHN